MQETYFRRRQCHGPKPSKYWYPSKEFFSKLCQMPEMSFRDADAVPMSFVGCDHVWISGTDTLKKFKNAIWNIASSLAHVLVSGGFRSHWASGR